MAFFLGQLEALLDEMFLVLFGVTAYLFARFLMDVVCVVFVRRGQAVDCLVVVWT